jgi:hypothetical protein
LSKALATAPRERSFAIYWRRTGTEH